jgi:hypothetical protein
VNLPYTFGLIGQRRLYNLQRVFHLAFLHAEVTLQPQGVPPASNVDSTVQRLNGFPNFPRYIVPDFLQYLCEKPNTLKKTKQSSTMKRKIARFLVSLQRSVP